MNLPVTGETARWLAIPFGILFGVLLHRGGVATYNVIVNQFRLKGFTVLKVMLTAIVVGAIGVLALHHAGYAQYHIKPTNLLGVSLGAAIFGVGMVLYGYCPGTGIAAVATGSVHALVGFVGMLAGGIAYALSFQWIENHIGNVGALGKIRFPEITGVPDWAWWLILAAAALIVFRFLERKNSRLQRPSDPCPSECPR